MNELTQSLDLVGLKAKAKESLYFFAKGILGYDWLVPHIHGPVCVELEDKSSNRKLVELPRGWLKTTLCSIAFPMWLSINNPDIRVLLTQNSATNACKKLSVIRGQWEQNDLLRAIFPELLPGRNSTWKADALCLSRRASFPESTYEAAGTSTKVVSRHYDVVIEDDTVAPDYDELGQESLAPSHEDVEKAIGWHRTNALPLLNNPSRDLILVVGTRWYDQDLIRWIKDNEPQYKIITRACREDDEGRPDPKGKVTYPERFDEKTLRELEMGLGPYMFSCLYMNTPVRREDMMFKPEWIMYYEIPPILSQLAIYTTIDTATDPKLSKSNDTDYSVVMTCGKDLTTGLIYVLDYFHQRCNPGELASAIFDHVMRFRPIFVGYQDVTFERSIDYWLKQLMRQEQVYFILQKLASSRKRDAKDTMISGLQPIFSSQSILLRSHMKALVSELLTYPLGRHDDLADALSMQLVIWRGTKTRAQNQVYKSEDPLSFDTAIQEIKARKGAGRASGPVFDPSRALSESPLTFGGAYN